MVTHLSNVSCLVTGGVEVPSPRGSHTSYNSPLPLDTQSFERLLYRRSTVGVVYLRSKKEKIFSCFLCSKKIMVDTLTSYVDNSPSTIRLIFIWIMHQGQNADER